MHEMSLCLSMIDLVSERARAEGATRVLRIKLTIGALGNVEPQALAFCFEQRRRAVPSRTPNWTSKFFRGAPSALTAARP